jgi:hypothetical protein
MPRALHQQEVDVAEQQESVATKAPAVSTDSPIRVKRRELEAQLKQQDADTTTKNQRARSTTKAMIDELRRIEDGLGHSRLHEMTPVGNLLQIPDEMYEKYPDHSFRFVNETIPGRAKFLQSNGYTRVEGEVHGGDLVLWMVPRQRHAERTAIKNELTDRNLKLATSGSQAEQTSKLQEFFDKHGVDVDVRRLILGGS